MKIIIRKEYLFWGFALLVSTILVIVWFSPFNYHVFVGDDLDWIKMYHLKMPSIGFWNYIFTLGNTSGKFRPIPTALILMATKVCQDSYDCFVGIDYFMITANVLLASIIAYILTSKWMPAVFISSVVIILSRFSYYAALQVLGIMENLAMTFVLLLALCFVRFARSTNVKWMTLTIILFLLILLTHERFVVLIVPVTFSLFIKRKELRTSQFVFLGLALILATSGYFWLREYVSHARFLTGAGSSSIIDTFNVSQAAFYMIKGTMNLIGFNAGPDYLSGKFFLSAGAGGVIVGLFLSGIVGTLFYLFLKQRRNKKSDIELGMVMVLTLMIGGMILASSITFRQEYRWLYTPFAVFVLLVCYFLSKLESFRTKYVMAMLVAISFVSVDVFYRPHMHNLYLINSAQMANSIKREIVDKHSRTELIQKKIFLVIENDVVKNWVLARGYFFDLYAPTIKVHYIKDLSEIPMNSITNDHLLVFSMSGTQVTRISQEVLMDRNMEFHNNLVEYDFTSIFLSAIWDDTYLAGTPSGYAVFPIHWHNSFGLTDDTITLVSPYDILFPPVKCKKGSKLIFSAGIPSASGDGADLSLDLAKKGKQERVLNVSLDPAQKEGIVTWNDYLVSLTDCNRKTPIAIKFSVSSPSGNSIDDWVALKNVKIVIVK